jgi:putative MATE family efflux protein
MGSSRTQDKSEEFASGKTFGLIIKYSIPTIIGMLVNALYAFIDRAFVGHLPLGEGVLGMAGINIAMPVTTIIFAVAMFAGAGAGANISISLGRGRKDLAEEYIGNGLVLGTVVALVASIGFILFREPILRAFGAAGDAGDIKNTLYYAEQYLTIMLIGATINTVGFCLSRFILAQGFTTVSMTAMIIGVVVNVALAPIFLFVFHWGVAGSAAATVVAQTVSAGFSLQFFLRKRMPLHIRSGNLKPDFAVIGRISSIGVSPGLLQMAMAFVQIVLNISLQTYGALAQSAMGVVNAVSLVLLMPIYGINQGVQPLIGFNYGAKLYHRVRKLLVQAILIATCIMVVTWGVLMLSAEKVVLLFGTDAGLMKLGPQAIRMFLMALPLVAFQAVSSNYFQAVGKPMHSLTLTMSRQVLFLLPAVLILPLFWGLNGVFLAGPVADVISTVLTGIFLIVELRHLTGRAEEGKTSAELLSAVEPSGEPKKRIN